MLSCKDITRLASEDYDKKLPFFKQLQFKMHLFMCKNCRNFVEQMNLTITTISQIKPIQPQEAEIEAQVNKLMEISKMVAKER